MKLLYSQAGYHTLSDKTAIMVASPDVTGGQFALAQDGHEVLRGQLQSLGTGHWLADFTRVRTTGWNALGVALSNGETAHATSFRISPVTYRGMAKETLLWLNPQRCGGRVEFWHGACHRKDAMMHESQDASGGWHAGDSWDKRADESWLAVWSCATLDATIRDFTVVPGEAMPHIVYEAAWGGNWLMQLQSADARFAAGVIRTGGVPVRAEDDTSAAKLGDSLDVPISAMIGYALCQLSIRARRHDRNLADRCLQSAAEVWRKHRTTPSTSLRAGEPLNHRMEWNAAFALLDLGLCCAIAARKGTFELNLTDTEPARDDLTARLDALLVNGSHGLAGGSDWSTTSNVEWMAPLALIEFIDKFPESEQSDRARVVANRFCDDAQRRARADAFSLLSLGETPAWLLGNERLLANAHWLARAADALDRSDLLALAERQVQWVWGRNPLAVSMMCGVGVESPALAAGRGRFGPQTGMRGLGIWFSPNAVYREHRDGYQVGGVVRGISSDRNGEPFLDMRSPDGERNGEGLECHRQTNAYSLPATAWMMLACCGIEQALTKLRAAG